MYIADLHDTDVKEDQFLYLRRVLRQIHQAQPRADLPDRHFEVVFYD